MPGVDGNQITFSTGTLTQKTLPTADSLKLDYDENDNEENDNEEDDNDDEDVNDNEDVNDEDVNDEDANDENDKVSLTSQC